MKEKKIYIILFLLLPSINSTIINAMLNNSSVIFNTSNNNEIILAKSLLKNNYIKNIYLYASKQDSLRILIRTLWHIFYNLESDALIPTKKGPISVITPEIFIEIINETYTSSSEHSLTRLYAQYLPQEILDIEKILNYLEKEARKTIQKLLMLEKNIELAENKKLELINLFEYNLTSSKAEKSKKLQEINKIFAKKSQEKETAIKNAIEQIDKKYDINNFKKLRENINIEISKLKEEKLSLIKEQKNTDDEIKNKKIELELKASYSLDQKLIELEVANTINDLILKIKLTKESQLYDPRITYGILWAYYLSKFSTQEIFESCQFPQEVKMGRFVCELSQGKISDKFSDCLESSVLDLISILLYNPTKKQYDQKIIPQNLTSGTGYKKIIKALKYAHIAEKNKLKELDYSLRSGCINFTSIKKLKALLNELNINKTNINNLNNSQVNNLNVKISDINTGLINSELVRQRWINIISNHENIIYNQEDKKCEILPLVENIINLLNYFYGTNATKIEDFGPIISFYDKETETKREISFELIDDKSNDSRPIIIVKINHKTKSDLFQNKNNLKFSTNYYQIKITLMKHHTVLEFKEREQSKNGELKKISTNLDPKEVRLNYYSLNIKDPKIQLAITKHALKNNILQYPDLKKLIIKLKDKLLLDQQLEYKLIKYIIIYGAYKKYPELKDYIIKRATQTLGVICQANIDICKQEFCELQKYLVDSDADINAKCEPHGDNLLIKAIKVRYLDLVDNILKNKDLEINKTGENKQTALHAAAITGNLKIIKKLLENKNIDANKLDDKNNTALNLAIENNRIDTVKFMLEYPKIAIPTLKTPIHSACTRNNENMLKFLLSSKKINSLAHDYNNNLPIHIAAFYGHTNLVQILAGQTDTDINAKGYKNRTALNLAAKNNKLPTVIWLLKHPKIDPNIQDSGGYTPLNRSIKNNFTKITKKILEHEKTDINLADRWGYSPLFWATKIEILRELMNNKKLNINHQDKRLKTALYWASAKGWTPIVKSILSHKEINPDLTNFLGKTPLSVAIKKNRKEIIDLIEMHKIKLV